MEIIPQHSIDKLVELAAGEDKAEKKVLGMGYDWLMAGVAVVVAALLVAIVFIMVTVFRRR